MEILQGLLDNLTALLAAHPLAGEWYMAFVRFLFPALAVLILYRAVRSLLRIPHTPENWGQLSLPNGRYICVGAGEREDLFSCIRFLHF